MTQNQRGVTFLALKRPRGPSLRQNLHFIFSLEYYARSTLYFKLDIKSTATEYCSSMLEKAAYLVNFAISDRSLVQPFNYATRRQEICSYFLIIQII